MRRRDFLGNTLAAVASSAVFRPSGSLDASDGALAKIEAATGGRLGVAVIATGTGPMIEHRGDERFPMCSTFKVLAVAAVLARVDRGEEQLGRHVSYSARDLLDYAPIARKYMGEGHMSIGALCQAAIEYSDNTAANLLVRSLDGPPAVTRFARSIGDPVTRLDRSEPDLNSAVPGDPRDTTTPLAMVRDLQTIILGTFLSVDSRTRLITWLVNCRTGEQCLRAGLPHSWRVGDKTGLGGPKNEKGDSNTRNDVAVAWPTDNAPIIVTAYLTGSKVSAAKRDEALAAVGRTVASGVSAQPHT
jgi:beta-lactamase class A